MDSITLDADMPMAEYARALMRAELAIIQQYEPDLRTETTVLAVHESRKAIRRTRTIFKLFGKQFKKPAIKDQRAVLRALMRRLAPARDTALFVENLSAYIANEALPADVNASLVAISDYWRAGQAEMDAAVRAFAVSDQHLADMAAYEAFVNTPGAGVREMSRFAPQLTRHLAPRLVLERLTAVRAHAPYLAEATVHELHALRIQFKELRYTLEFFRPILSDPVDAPLEELKIILTHLGDLNDVTVHRHLLAQTDGYADGVALYDGVKSAESERLIESLYPLYAAFDTPAWREPVMLSLAAL
jgi:CHAD domain-containing protein